MGCETESKEIDGMEFSVTQWPASKALLTKFKLIKIFGASIALSASGIEINSNSKSLEVDGVLISDGLSKLFQDTSPEEVFDIMKGCIIGVACNGEKINNTTFEMLFSGDSLSAVYKVFMFVLKVNYSALMKGQQAKELLAKVGLE